MIKPPGGENYANNIQRGRCLIASFIFIGWNSTASSIWEMATSLPHTILNICWMQTWTNNQDQAEQI